MQLVLHQSSSTESDTAVHESSIDADAYAGEGTGSSVPQDDKSQHVEHAVVSSHAVASS